MKINEVLNEAPIQDIDHVGDFSKGSSFTDKRDRLIVTHPASIENIKKKFGKVDTNINLLFVNTKEGRKFTEVGNVSEEWIHENLGEEVQNAINKMNTEDALTVIFTNNKGDQRVPMTPWIIAHRIMHALARPSFSLVRRGFKNESQYYGYKETADQIIYFIGNYVMPAYLGHDRYPKTYDKLLHGDISNYDSYPYYGRKDQLLFKYLFHEIGTFKSARDKNIRDWFEVINELGAQYIITGDIKFNELPKVIGPKGFGRQVYLTNEEGMIDQAETALDSLGHYIKTQMDQLLEEATGTIVVM